jgi:hypothetical protein
VTSGLNPQFRKLLFALSANNCSQAGDDAMKFVRFGENRTGLVINLPAGAHILDIVASVSVLLPEDPISNGIVNGILKDGGSWGPLVEHWPRVRVGLRRLANVAHRSPDHPHLVLRSWEDARVMPASSSGIASMEISDAPAAASLDPTGRAAMTDRFTAAHQNPAATKSPSHDARSEGADNVVVAFPRNGP